MNEDASDSANMVGIPMFHSFNFVISQNKWVVDLGATQHMTVVESLMSDIEDVSKLNLFVNHPNGSYARIEKIGNISLSHKVTLFDVFVVLDFNVNLLYVHKLCKDSKCEVVFNEHNCKI